jgi:hypothetical protein
MKRAWAGPAFLDTSIKRLLMRRQKAKSKTSYKQAPEPCFIQNFGVPNCGVQSRQTAILLRAQRLLVVANVIQTSLGLFAV